RIERGGDRLAFDLLGQVEFLAGGDVGGCRTHQRAPIASKVQVSPEKVYSEAVRVWIALASGAQGTIKIPGAPMPDWGLEEDFHDTVSPQGRPENPWCCRGAYGQRYRFRRFSPGRHCGQDRLCGVDDRWQCRRRR